MSGITVLAVLDEFGDFVGEFQLPFALTEEQQHTIRHGSEYKSFGTYFWVIEGADFPDPKAIDLAQEMIAQLHVLAVKEGEFR